MRYWLLAGVSALCAFALAAFAATLAARLAHTLLRRRLGAAAPPARARILFRLRTLPIVAASTAAFAVALPIFLWFEERDTTEPVSLTLTLVAAGGLLLLARGVWRAAAAWRATAVMIRGWQRQGRAVDGLRAPMPVVAIEDTFPTVAVAGIFRPRLFVAERVLREFTAPEVAAMVAHECAHVSARDNAKRLLVRTCPDVLGMPRLEREWLAAAEEAADARAAALAPSARLDLAQALIRVARLGVPAMPQLASAFYLGGSIETRVRRLVEPVPAPALPSRWRRIAAPLALAALAAALVAAAPALHALMEQAVRVLP